ncbi:MAG: FAD-binding oxidoreductase [Thermoplasmata archaeon]|nr:FAD-binding oxidoreductase [Thermoplasmata archaeon]
MVESQHRVLVLGAGLAGVSLALHLARRHLGPVAVVDPRTVAGGATGRAAGIVTTQLWNSWDVEVARETQQEYSERAQHLGRGAYRRTGFVRWTQDAEKEPILERARERFRSWGVETSTLRGGELAEKFPWAEFDERTVGLYSSEDACVNPTELAGDYVEEGRRLGVRYEFGQVLKLPRRSGSVWELDTPSGPIRAEQLVLAAGAWSKRLAAELGHPLPLAPYRTQAALIRPLEAPPETFPAAHDIDHDVYLRPEDASRILVGNGTELREVDPDQVPGGGTPEFLEHIAFALAQRWPRWQDSEVSAAWSGVCDATPDRRPLIGALDPRRSLYVLAGFNGFGVMRAAGAARRLAELLADGSGDSRAAERLAPVRPDRFGPVLPSFGPQPGFTLEDGDLPRC